MNPFLPYPDKLRGMQRRIQEVILAREEQILREAIIRYCGGMPCREFCGYMGKLWCHPDGTKELSWGRRENVIAVIPPLRLWSGGGR